MNAVIDRVVQYPNRFQLTNISDGTVLGTFDLSPVTGTVSVVGTILNHDLFQSIADDLASRIKTEGGVVSNTIETFTMAGTRTNIVSGETISVSFGKIAKIINDLKAVAFSGNKADIGLGNVVNTADTAIPAKDSTDKFTSGGAYAELAKKVDKVAGSSLMTDAEHNKLSGIADGAEVNVQSDWSEVDSSQDDFIKNKPSIIDVSSADYASDNTQLNGLTIDGTDYKLLDVKVNDGSSLIIGNNRKLASGANNAVAIGYCGSSTAGGNGSTALGFNSTASGFNGSTAIGFGSTASANSSTAIGYGSTASTAGSTALGFNSTASGSYGSTALGFSSTASDSYGSTALGYGSTASGGNGSTAIGFNSKVYVPHWVGFDGTGDDYVRTVALKSTDNIFFRNENVDASKKEQASYTSGKTLTQVLNTKQDKLTFDTTPTADSTNPVTSGGVYTAVAKKLDKGDWREYQFDYVKDTNIDVLLPSLEGTYICQILARGTGDYSGIMTCYPLGVFSVHGINGNAFMRGGSFVDGVFLNLSVHISPLNALVRGDLDSLPSYGGTYTSYIRFRKIADD